MKKISVVMLGVVSAIMLLAGCADKEELPFTQKSYEVEGAKVEEVNIEVQDNQIEVSLSDDDQIHIEYFENEKEYYDISVSDDYVLTMTAENSKEWKDYVGSKSEEDVRKISLQIPDALLSKLKIATTNEEIMLSELNVKGDIIISNNGGDISFEKMNVGNALNLAAKNGDIEGTVVGGYDDFAISSKVKKGDCNLPSEKKDGAKTLEVVNNNGDIDIEFVRK